VTEEEEDAADCIRREKFKLAKKQFGRRIRGKWGKRDAGGGRKNHIGTSRPSHPFTHTIGHKTSYVLLSKKGPAVGGKKDRPWERMNAHRAEEKKEEHRGEG